MLKSVSLHWGGNVCVLGIVCMCLSAFVCVRIVCLSDSWLSSMEVFLYNNSFLVPLISLLWTFDSKVAIPDVCFLESSVYLFRDWKQVG